ncbi:hypothetical protein [Streptomyces sp. NBC_01451]|uniref:hypothetical protein n=1 Tax=Streptomyces sp. NBC_01451 TaxID=2903872 RepID=UPI002E308192|nr:hypothetical protein [Streptomyces sp. NBC_01451]
MWAQLGGLFAVATPARAREATRELPTVDDDGATLDLAARLAPAACSSDLLLRELPRAADPDHFCELLLASAFTREGRTEPRLRNCMSFPCWSGSPP